MRKLVMVVEGTSKSLILDRYETERIECLEDEVHQWYGGDYETLEELAEAWFIQTEMNGDLLREIEIIEDM